MRDVAIKVDGVYKDFILPHEKTSSVKSAFTGLYHRKTHAAKSTTQHALKDVSFEVKKGEFFGIVGRNGSGKSTLLKILAGIYQPTKGSVTTNGKLVPFIELGVGFNPELTGRENVYLNGAMLGFSQREVDSMYDDIVSFAELGKFMDQKLKNYSSGMQVRLAFSMATRAKANVLLVDEVLAVGDADFQRKCFDFFKQLKKQGTTVVFVTHDMGSVREYCDRAILIDNSEIIMSGTADDVASGYTRLFQHNTIDAAVAGSTKRWGDQKASIEEVSIQKKSLNDADDFLEFTVVAKAHAALESIVIGFTLKDATGRGLLGTNTLLKKYKIKDLKESQIVKTAWKVPNIFREGTYTLDIAVNHANGIDVHDWWEEAASFTVVSEDYSQYIVNPTIEVTIGER